MELINTVEQKNEDTSADTNKVEKENEPAYVPLEAVNTADTTAVKESDGLLNVADSVKLDEDTLVEGGNDTSVEITQQDKNKFIEAVITGDRFVSEAKLFGGRVTVRFRSRSMDETEAILAYIHRQGVLGKFETRTDVHNATLAALLVAQVQEYCGVEYPPMKKPYKFTEGVGGVQPPAWVDDMKIWSSKSDAVVAALGSALVSFEAKYWKMIEASKDENFWNPGGSTGE